MGGVVSRFLALAGLILLPFGLVSFALTGVFDLWTAVHVAGGGILLAGGAAANLAGLRRTVSRAGTWERARGAAGVLLFVATLVALNVLVARRPWRFDSTENRIHSLSDHARAVAERVRGGPVEIFAFLGAGGPGRHGVEEILRRFAEVSPALRYRVVDPEREPQLAERFGVRSRDVLVVSGPGGASQAPFEPARFEEGVVTTLLLKALREGPRTIYVLEGHGEPSTEELGDPDGLGAFAALLREEGFAVRRILLTAETSVPSDAAGVLVVGPRKDLLAQEIEILRSYLARGGGLLVLLDPGPDAGLGPLLFEEGVAIGDDMIVDREQIPFQGARLGLDPVIEDFSPHPAQRGFEERIVLFQARSVDARDGEAGLEVRARVLARTRDTAWATPGYREMLVTGRVSQLEQDRSGPVPVAVAVEADLLEAGRPSHGDEESVARRKRLVVVGDADLARNAHLGDFFNAEYLHGVVEWLAGREDLVVERSRGYRPSRLDMTEADYRVLFRLGVLMLPEAILILGLGIWWRRRSL